MNNGTPTVTIELFTSRVCETCERKRRELTDLLIELELPGRIELVDVVTEIDRAVALGVRRVPAIAVNGRLLAGTSAAEIRRFMQTRRTQQ